MLIKKILALAAAWLFVAGPAYAGMRLHGSTSISAVGKAQLNIGSDLLPANFNNILGTAALSFSAGATPGTAALDVNGYPTRSFTGLVNVSLAPTFWSGVTYTFTWTSGTKLSVINLGNNSGCSLSGVGGSVSGCTGGNVTLTVDGTGAGSMTFTPTGFSLQFPGTGVYGAANTANLKLSRTTDVGASGYITPEYKATLLGLHLESFRSMGIDGAANGNEANWNYRAPPAAIGWQTRYPLGAWSGGSGSAGTISGTDQYTAAAAPDTSLSGWVANEVLQGAVTNPSSTLITISNVANNGSGLCRITVNSTSTITTNQNVWVSSVLNSSGEIMSACSNAIFPATVINGTTIDLQGSAFSGTFQPNTACLGTCAGFIGTQTLTITGKSGGAKFIADLLGYPPGTNNGDVLQSGIGTFTYDAILDRVLYSSGAIVSAFPIEIQASIANSINANLWANLPAMADDNFVTNWASLACSSLNASLNFHPEYSNEVWNFSQTQTPWAQNRGLAFGFPKSGDRAIYDWYGLRVRQIMGNLIPAACGSHSLRRSLEVWLIDPSGQQPYRLNGADLAPSGIGTGIGNAAYSAFTGSANYTTFPNRPVDVVESVGHAPYVAGTNFSDQGSNGGTVASAGNAPFLQTLATAFNSNPNDPTSLAALDNDQRQGTVSTLTQTFACPTGTTVTLNSNGFSNTASNNMPAVFTVSGGTVCNGLALNTAYCFINVTTNTFQVAAYTSAGACGSTPISMSPGTGTPTVGPMNYNTILGIATTYDRAWETVAASYDASGRSSPLRVDQYEGAIQPVTPDAGTLSSIGVTVGGSGATANAALQAGLIAWKNSNLAKLSQQYYFSSFAALAHSGSPSNLVLPGPSQYSLLSGSLPNSTPYQLYNGFAAFSTP